MAHHIFIQVYLPENLKKKSLENRENKIDTKIQVEILNDESFRGKRVSDF